MADRMATRTIDVDGPLWDRVQRLVDGPGGVLLESGGPVTPLSRWSIASGDPYRVVTVDGDRVGEYRPREDWSVDLDAGPRDVLADVLPSPAPDPSGPPFPEAFVYLGYEALQLFEDVPVKASGRPDVVCWFVDRFAALDRLQGRLHLVGTSAAGQDPERVVDDLADALGPRTPGPVRDIDLQSTHTRQGYADIVEDVRDYVRAGDVFQVNVAQRYQAPRPGDPRDVYDRLRRTNPGPFNAYADLGPFQLASSSPERLVRYDRDRIDARPIAGTRPRGDGDRDEALARELLADDKEAAEHAMIVDLYRNDVARVAEPGSVRVDPYRSLERYARVQHLTSNVVGEPRSEADPVDVIEALFPGGSITGAPKVRAMEIIHELEPVARGPYTGSLGYVGPTGMDLNILIRTLVLDDDRVRLSAGGGVVTDSDPAAEHDESKAKARALMEALHAGRPAPHAISYRSGGAWSIEPVGDARSARVFVVDNYDSFVHNLAHHLGMLGADVQVARHDEVTVDAIEAWDPTHVVLSPGPKGPGETGICPDVVDAFDGDVPLLGVCLGHQVIAAHAGADVVQAPAVVHGKSSTIRHDGRGVLAGVPSPIAGARYHSLHVPAPPDGFEAIAWTDDDLLMGIRADDRPTVGLAFHPESVLTDHGSRILANVLDLAPTVRREPVRPQP